jgi:hypothetical protein
MRTSYRNFIVGFTYYMLKIIKTRLPFRVSLHRNLGVRTIFQFADFLFVFGIPVLKISIMGTNVFN